MIYAIKDQTLFIEDPTGTLQRILKAWESFNGWYWFAVEEIQTQDSIISGQTHENDTIWFGLVQGHEEEWGDFSQAEIEQLAPLTWELIGEAITWSGRQRRDAEACFVQRAVTNQHTRDQVVQTLVAEGAA